MTRTMNMTLLLCTRKGLVLEHPIARKIGVRRGTRCSRRSPGLRVAIGIADSGGAFPFAQWPCAKDSLTVARQRGFFTRFPVPPKRNARTLIGKEPIRTSCAQDRA